LFCGGKRRVYVGSEEGQARGSDQSESRNEEEIICTSRESLNSEAGVGGGGLGKRDREKKQAFLWPMAN
jgi:hypothetical protein